MAGTPELRVNVRLSGPTVEGRAPAELDRMMASAVTELADYTKHEVLMQLDKVLQHPTGYYESHITDEPLGLFQHRIHDDMVVYGPWLEGVGSRNYPVTRFRGYHSFRIVKNRMAQLSKRIVEAHLARTIGRL
jgi:hypothetical protein